MTHITVQKLIIDNKEYKAEGQLTAIQNIIKLGGSTRPGRKKIISNGPITVWELPENERSQLMNGEQNFSVDTGEEGLIPGTAMPGIIWIFK